MNYKEIFKIINNDDFTEDNISNLPQYAFDIASHLPGFKYRKFDEHLDKLSTACLVDYIFNNPEKLQLVKNQTIELCIVALTKNPCVFKYINDDLITTDLILTWFALMDNNPKINDNNDLKCQLFKQLDKKYKTPELCRYAISWCPSLIRVIKQTNELCNIAITAIPESLAYVTRPTVDMAKLIIDLIGFKELGIIKKPSLAIYRCLSSINNNKAILLMDCIDSKYSVKVKILNDLTERGLLKNYVTKMLKIRYYDTEQFDFPLETALYMLKKDPIKYIDILEDNDLMYDRPNSKKVWTNHEEKMFRLYDMVYTVLYRTNQALIDGVNFVNELNGLLEYYYGDKSVIAMIEKCDGSDVGIIFRLNTESI